MKLEVLRRFEEGEKLTQIARALGLATSTVASIRVNKDKIRANSQAATPVSAMQLIRCRDNIAEAWAELQPATMNSAWRKLWPECVPASAPEPDAVPQLRRSIVALASHVGLGDVAEADVTRLLQAHGEPPPRGIPQDAEDGDPSASELPWEAGKGLASRRPEADLTEAVVGAGTEEEAGVGALSPEHLAQALSHFAAGLRVLTENDPNRERSLWVSRGVHCALARLRELHRERRRQDRAPAPSGGPVVVVAATRELAGSLHSPQVGPTGWASG
ncbi:hypothetical protein HPG69_007199 [Diceros bicornis minor]|uniref:HTH psq-type domain-containing protein n=1 Tax=Diceros bicornis minor TaxID=77932 RepID=A0A7J7FN35_DICBM|nr:hypothetical protein HPG69_007199 [Diceros bicornis minor]